MNNICRLCLSVPSEIMCIVLTKECDLLTKIRDCLSIELLLDKSLPSQICCVCSNKIEEICDYHKIIKHNQEVLLKLTIADGFETDKSEENKLVFKIETNLSDNDYNTTSPFGSDSIKKDAHGSSEDEVLSNSNINDKQQYEIKTKVRLPKNRKIEKLKKNKSNLENLQYKCLMCFIDCKSQNDLTKHYTGHEEITNKNNEALNLDSDADKKYKTNTLEDGKIIYECCTCAKLCNKSQDIHRHVAGHRRPFVCKLCGRTYRSVYEIVRHGRAHNGESFHCSFGCGFSTVYKGALRSHEKRHGKPVFKFTCEKCGKGFHVKTWHDQHQNVHSGLKPFTCDICGVAFHMDRYLTAHRSKMHPQTSSIKKYICVICSLPCDTRNSLKKHMEEHGFKSSLLCDLCGKVFANTELLKYHKNSHLGIKPYTCSVCNKTFVKKFNLKMHELTHTGERAHACTLCGKHFTQRSALRRHERRYHTKPKLFQDNLATDRRTPK